ncbi:cytochrome c oxidase accessory protein CcoG [Aggregicoccus sp. 17bor-14]|uniref:cytochrome c oxidase accessory protein CcoG n=1 Tax=Myxococcaceae TaxID=31 RepID=UPI0012F29AE2|nr:cytochrome c oxidase accessory protein CcoG [Simulacricoccus sp. 17bor-14]MRI91432.1 cytochrome c oxidase accessory protein CcoG [Aggregicoccus sp. 17bor-14]
MTPAPSSASLRTDGRREAIHPSDVKGRFLTRRRALFAGLMAFYLLLPLLRVGGHPAVYLDVTARRFYLFGATFNAQDFWLVLFLATTAGFALLFATAWLGRVWCGWACPQTVFLEGLYRPIERWVDGPRERRLKMAKAPWTAVRVGRAGVKHAAYLFVSLAISHVALSFFLSAEQLLAMVREGPAAHPVPFAWAVAVTGLLHFNYVWFREQLCVAFCPYGRLQSAMQDDDSLIVGYDVRRGEPRGHLRRPGVGEAAKVALPVLGDCVDCNKCVTACPTGIDIRNGLQLECVACALCADACDAVMDKVGRPRGLIRYDSLNGLAGKRRRVLRPRLVVYGALLLASASALGMGLLRRSPFEANLLRFRGAPYVVTDGSVRNQYELHLVNKHPDAATFRVRVHTPGKTQVLLPQAEVKLASLEGFRLPLFVTSAKDDYVGPFGFTLEVEDVEAKEVRSIQARFLGPSY